jgi:hypothetical protein
MKKSRPVRISPETAERLEKLPGATPSDKIKHALDTVEKHLDPADRRAGDRILFTWYPESGRRCFLCDPKGRTENANYLILWNGKDWSGFLTHEELLGRVAELEATVPPKRLYLFDAVERL